MELRIGASLSRRDCGRRRRHQPHWAAVVAIVAVLASSSPAAGQSPTVSGQGPADSTARVRFSSPQRLVGNQPWRTALEFGGVFGMAIYLYFNDGRIRPIERSVADGFAKIFSPSRLLFDDNTFDVNNVSHPAGGLLYYGLPRANGASARTAFLMLLGASVFWEQVVELQEIASINDHIGTPISGFALGEAAFQSRLFFRRGARTPAHRVLDAFFGFPVALTEIVADRPATAPAAVLDARGLPADVAGRFRFWTGAGRQDGSDERLGLGVRWELGIEADVQNVGRADVVATRAGWFRDIAATRLDLTFTLQDGKLSEARAFAQVVPAGWYAHDVAATARRGLRGRTLLVGPTAWFEYDALGFDGYRFIQRVAVYALGMKADLRLLDGVTRVRVVGDLAANFANVGSTGRYGYPAERLEGESSTFVSQAYYHAAGATGDVHASIERGAVELRAGVRQHRFTSIDTRDRYPERATAIMPKDDRWTTLSAAVAVRPLRAVELSVGHGRRWFRGSIAEHDAAMRAHSSWARIAFAF